MLGISKKNLSKNCVVFSIFIFLANNVSKKTSNTFIVFSAYVLLDGANRGFTP
jgi:hypothetical protein